MNQIKKVYDLNIAREKIQSFCAYQERSHKQVREKLWSYGLKPEIIDELQFELIQNNFLNEERFAIAFTSGKMRIKKWGRHKINQHLKQHQVSEYNIKRALNSIEDIEYKTLFFDLAAKKWSNLKGESPLKRKEKFFRYMYNRGFEKELTYEFLNDLD